MTATIIPTVKEQARRWASGRSAKGADEPQPGRETLDARNLKILGSVGRSTFATHSGRELRLKGPVMPHRIDEAPADVIVVRQPKRSEDGRTRLDHYLATVVEVGSFERMAARKRYRPRERRAGTIDGLAELRKPADRLPVRFGKEADTPEDIIMGALSKRPMLLWTDGAAMPLTVRRLIEVANAAGANVRHHKGHTLADWSVTWRWRALLIAAWPLVDAHLAGTPLACAYEHKGTVPPADTLDPVGVPVCNQHVGQGPPAA